MENSITSKDISNRKDYAEIKRKVFVKGFYFGTEQITLQTVCMYFDANGKDITYKFAPNIKELIANNFKRKDVLDAENNLVFDAIPEQEVVDGLPIFNEDGTPKMVEKQVKRTIGLYDYFKNLANQPVPLIAMFQSIINDNDLLGTYDI